MPPLDLPKLEFTILALLLIAFGTGGIKPCVSAFGGDQFKLPEQERYLGYFFSLFYFSINAGSLISTFLTPILRADVHCFGENDCYSLAFGVPGLLMIVSIVFFVAGKRLYIIKNPAGNVLGNVSACVGYALVKCNKSKEKREHWLDHADDKYDSSLIEDVKGLLRVLVLFIPLPIFWALFDQQVFYLLTV
ncbi:Peptide transporter family 1 [Papilio xuthus]|uniref:Peptide transporter family 1 n=1 Tax=Papilio xuthus TaxID=66420 RepID=A0A0N0P9R7_PAPXU|nr:Peptide transporter family 1 [Papilio xuthus]